MKCWLFKSGRGWLPDPNDDDAVKLHRQMEPGECAEFRVIRPRSVRWHRLYFALCKTIGENQDPQREADSIDSELRILAGHYEVMHMQGYEVRVPKRIAFDKMTGDEWAAYFQKVEVAVSERFGPEYMLQMGNAA